MWGGVVERVVGPAAPEDPDPAGADAAKCPVVLLAAAAGLLVGGTGPVALADGVKACQSMAWRMRLLTA